MKMIKNIAGRLWALWGLLLFVLTMLPALVFYLPCALLREPARARWHRSVSRVWMFVYLNLIGCPIKIVNKKVFQKGQNYIVVCNHNSLIDVPLTTPFMPNANKTIAKKSFANVPFFGWIYRWGSVLVDRKDDHSRIKSFLEMKHVLHIGLDMVLYPEGTRNKTDLPLTKFYSGAFRLSKETGKPIIPALLFHSRKVLPADKPFFLSPSKLELHFLPPVSPENYSANELKEKIFREMWDYYVAHQ